MPAEKGKPSLLPRETTHEPRKQKPDEPSQEDLDAIREGLLAFIPGTGQHERPKQNSTYFQRLANGSASAHDITTIVRSSSADEHYRITVAFHAISLAIANDGFAISDTDGTTTSPPKYGIAKAEDVKGSRLRIDTPKITEKHLRGELRRTLLPSLILNIRTAHRDILRSVEHNTAFNAVRRTIKDRDELRTFVLKLLEGAVDDFFAAEHPTIREAQMHAAAGTKEEVLEKMKKHFTEDDEDV